MNVEPVKGMRSTPSLRGSVSQKAIRICGKSVAEQSVHTLLSGQLDVPTDICRELDEPDDEGLEVENDKIAALEEASVDERVLGHISFVQWKYHNKR